MLFESFGSSKEQAINVVMSEENLKDAKGRYKELDAAFDKWGIVGEKQKNIY